MAIPIQEERFEYKGVSCVVLFMPTGHRCGYVALPKGHKFYGSDFDSIEVECHGGLTYSENRLHHQDDKDVWWIGFDCGHYCDGVDVEKLKEYYGNDKSVAKTVEILAGYYSVINKERKIKTLEYVKENCKSIVDQLLKGDTEK